MDSEPLLEREGVCDDEVKERRGRREGSVVDGEEKLAVRLQRF